MILGAGDAALPLVLAAALAKASVLSAFLIAFFALLGLLFVFLLFLSQKERQALPALPPIALFCALGYFLVSFF
jgi:Flp pilus assembly protein protease CpaA